MTIQEEQDVIAAIEDAAIVSMPAHIPIASKVDLVNRIRRSVARELKGNREQPTA